MTLCTVCAQTPTDADGVPLGDRAGTPLRADRLERHGITWQFDTDYVVGAFCNGDPWVVGPVKVVAITPACREVDGRVQNGAMVDPDPSTLREGYDTFALGEDDGSRYDAERNVARGLSAQAPLVLQPVSSLVSVVSMPQAKNPPTLKTAAVLTCVDAPPAPDAFRPPYVKGDKPMVHRATDLDFSVLRKLAPVGDAPLIEAVARDFERLWLDHFPEWVVRYAHPGDNMPNYGRDIGAKVGTAALLLNLDLPDAQKRDLLIRLVQFGIDTYGALQSGCRWKGVGGHGHGRKLPILIAGAVLHDERLSNVGRDYVTRCVLDGGKGAWFAEDGQTFFVRETSDGVYNWGHGGYTKEHADLPEWGFSHADHPENDDPRWDQNPYRLCCTANAWVGQALAARVMGLREAWNHEAWFDYVDRYQQATHEEAWHRAWESWQVTMWDAYRANH